MQEKRYSPKLKFSFIFIVMILFTGIDIVSTSH